MKTKSFGPNFAVWTVAAVTLIAIAGLASCANSLGMPNPETVRQLSSGEVGRAQSLVVVFIKPWGESLEPAGLLSTWPAVDGKASWQDPYTLVFQPSQLLAPDTRYVASVEFPDFLDSAGAENGASAGAAGAAEFAQDFRFNFNTPPISVTPSNLTIEYENPAFAGELVASGEFVFSDAVSPEEAYGLVSASIAGRELELNLLGQAASKVYPFRIEGLVRKQAQEFIKFGYKNTALRVSRAEPAQLKLPALGDFSVMDVRTREFGGTALEIVFSEPLDQSQDLRGLISISASGSGTVAATGAAAQPVSLSFVPRNNLLRVFASDPWPAEFTLSIEPGIRSHDGAVLVQASTESIVIANELPEVRFVGTGTIIPDASSAFMPVETRNLRALMIQAIKVHENNFHQFAQENAIDGTRNLQRVGTVVWEKVVDLDWNPQNTNRWVRQGLDISELVRDFDPGFYHIVLTFRRPHIVYETGGAFADDSIDFPFWPDMPNQVAPTSNWDYFQEDYYESWQNRRNPVHPAYYRAFFDHNITVGRNVFVSKLAPVAQLDRGGNLRVQLLDLVSSNPISGATVEVSNYQQLELATGQTDAQGMYQAALQGLPSPFLVRVSHGSQQSYLRLSPGDELNTSHFDTGGVSTNVAVQGVLYGERSVWRPGDTMYLTFVLRDRFDELPTNHPVTLTIRSPRGSEVFKETRTQSVQGMYAFPVPTSANYETGPYQARVQVGSHEFFSTLRVETVIPNRLKIDVTTNSQDGLLLGGRLSGSISSAWLHGATAGGLKAEMEARLSPATTSFSRFSGYSFDDPTREVPSSVIDVFEGWLNSTGSASFDKQLASLMLPGHVSAQLTTRVYEQSGGFSSEYVTTKLSPYTGYAGVKLPPGDSRRGMLLTDVEHRVDLALVDEQGNPRSGQVRVELFKLNWQWWWVSDGASSSYFGSENSTPISSRTIAIRNGVGQTSIQVNYPEWGRYGVFVTDMETGHRAAKIFYIDWPGWASRAMAGPGDAPNILSFTPNKTNYTLGETAVVALPLGTAGRALATVEANGRIVAQSWVQPRGDASQYSFRVTEEMLPNAYIHISYIQPYSANNDRPLRSLGVVPITVSDSQTELKPILTAPSEIRPGTTASITVRESTGRPMGYTVAIVDEGLLGLTRFQTPNLWSSFYARTASMLRHFDLYNKVGGVPRGELASLIGVGGDGFADSGERESQSRWDPVVIYQEPRYLAAGAENTHSFDIPEYLGAVRIMVVAVDQAGSKDAYGKTDATVFVRKPLMVLGTVPRVLSPGDEITLPVNIFTFGLGNSSTSVEMLTEGKIAALGSTSQVLATSQDGEYNAVFRARVAAAAGEAKITFRATNGSRVSEHSIPVEVRIPTAPETRTVSVALNPGETRTIQIQLFGVLGTNELTAELSNFRPIDLDSRLQWLIRYPYGCVEQTTSSLFPQLYLDKLTNLSSDMRRRIQTNITAGIARLQNFQNSTGGFTYWMGGSEPATAWSNIYVGHFLLEARTQGYTVPTSMIDSWLNFERGKANSAGIRQVWEQVQQAYRLYVLALAGQPDMGAMNRLAQVSNLNTLAKLRLAHAYQLAGSRTQASLLLSQSSSPRLSYDNQGLLYGSVYRDMAMAMQTYIALADLSSATAYAEQISAALSSPTSYSTQSLAFMLMGMADYAQAAGVGQPINAQISWNGEYSRVTGSDFIVTKPLGAQGLGAGSRSLTISNNASVVSVARFILRGNPMPQDTAAATNGLVVRTSYIVEKGSIDPADGIAVGEELTVRVIVSNPGRTPLKEVATTLLVPAGLELVNPRLAGGSTSASSLRYEDFRDDRVYAFFDLPANGTVTLDFRAIGAYLGRYYVPGASAEVMYEPTITGRSAGSVLNVLPTVGVRGK